VAAAAAALQHYGRGHLGQLADGATDGQRACRRGHLGTAASRLRSADCGSEGRSGAAPRRLVASSSAVVIRLAKGIRLD
jgi:hypothetical protein